jgi:hypothetical protein
MISGPQLAGSLKDPAGLFEEADMRLTALISILILSTAPTSADSIYLPILNMGLDGLQVEVRTMSKPSEKKIRNAKPQQFPSNCNHGLE